MDTTATGGVRTSIIVGETSSRPNVDLRLLVRQQSRKGGPLEFQESGSFDCEQREFLSLFYNLGGQEWPGNGPLHKSALT